MPVRKKTSTTRLPQALREEIDGSFDTHQIRRKNKPQLSRKDARKQERTVRKQNKAKNFSLHPAHLKRPAEDDPEEPQLRKKPKHDRPTTSAPLDNQPVSRTKPRETALSPKLQPSPAPKPSQTGTRPKRPPKGANVKPRTRIEDEEESYIAYLESKLGYSKAGKERKGEDDGLDDLFALADSLLEPTQEDYEEHSVEESFGQSEDESSEEWGGICEMPHVGDEEEENDEQNSQILKPIEPLGVDSSGQKTRYIPPHLRQRENGEDTIKLTRQLKGLLNRMSEQNMAEILDTVEKTYRDHRRNDVTSTLTTLIIDGIASHSSHLDSYVVMYAAFVASLHKIIGVEFAAHFTQTVVSLYERYYISSSAKDKESNIDSSLGVEEKGKECSNLIVLLSELYNFQVISSTLIFDIIRGLLDEGLSELSIELLLKIVRNSGQQLRQDDPSALKVIIQIVQDKVSDTDDALSSRTRFMIETMTNLKNNKLKRNITQNQGAEVVDRMKKFLTGLAKKRHALSHEPLRVSLEDLRSAETKGKWWLVGAAWGGDPLAERQDAPKSADKVTDDTNGNDLLKLARKQGMNTDIRRSIFVVLMSSDDYVDACERLSQLNLNEVQQREIVRVILHCCGNEKSYNPYYTLVCQHLCSTSHSYKITLQFCLWDFFRDLGETSVGGERVVKDIQDDSEASDLKNISSTRIRNIAKAYAWWIAKDCVTLAILKPVDFTALKPQSHAFLRELLAHVYANSQISTPVLSSSHIPATRNREAIEKIFIKATRIESLTMGLVYFMSEAFRDLSREQGELSKLIQWANGVGKDALRAGVDVV